MSVKKPSTITRSFLFSNLVFSNLLFSNVSHASDIPLGMGIGIGAASIYLLGDAAESSLVKQKYGLIAITGLMYKF